MKIAIAQLNPTIGDVVGNAQKIIEAAQQAVVQGARLMLTPELSIVGYPPRDLLMRPGFIDGMEKAIAQLAQSLPPNLAVLVGTAKRNPQATQQGGKSLFNSIVLLEQGKCQRLFHKRLLPTYDVFDDQRYFQPHYLSSVSQNTQHRFLDTSQPNVFVLDGMTIGVTICEDLWNDEDFWGRRIYENNPLEDLIKQGVGLIVNLSGSPYCLGKQQIRESMLSHSAARYQCPIIYVNQVGSNDDLIFDGNSVAFNRRGELMGRASAFTSDLQIITISSTFKSENQLLKYFDIQTGYISPTSTDENAELWDALVLGVRDYARKCGFSKAVIGLSGGIDSALVAAIATKALGANNVLGVLMPSPYSSDHSVNDALALAQSLGINTETLPIGALMEGYDHTFVTLFADTEFGVAEENLQSRIRGTLLMAIANKFGYLLLSTGNKSEMAVGYCTLYGDMNGGLAVIADVPKTRVYALCSWLNQQAAAITAPHPLDPQLTFQRSNNATPDQFIELLPTEIIPIHILEKPPSAELKPGQVDQDSLPPYDQLDDILERLINHHQSLNDIVAVGHNAAIVQKVIRLVTRAEFKRRQAPPGLKVTDRAFGTGWRMPIAARYSG